MLFYYRLKRNINHKHDKTMNSTDKYAFWQRLRKSPVQVQYRYQRLLNHCTGKLLTGFELDEHGVFNLILE